MRDTSGPFLLYRVCIVDVSAGNRGRGNPAQLITSKKGEKMAKTKAKRKKLKKIAVSLYTALDELCIDDVLLCGDCPLYDDDEGELVNCRLTRVMRRLKEMGLLK